MHLRRQEISVLLPDFLLALFLMCCLSACYNKPSGDLILYDFESDADLEQFTWHCHTLFSLSDEHPAHGSKSLKLELFPSDYPGLAPKIKQKNWKGYKEFNFDVYNPQKNNVLLTVRIDDRKNSPDYEDRYNKGFLLSPGMNHIRIPFDTLVTSAGKRSLNLGNICQVLLFTAHPEQKIVLFFDYLILSTLPQA